MDSESKGQVGGLECGEGTRRALARESRAWRCGGCGGRTNVEVLGEVGERVRQMEREKGLGREEVRVPGDLRLAYRDEMGRGAEGEKMGTGERRLGTTEAEAEVGTPTLSADAAPRLDPVKPDAQDPPPQPTRTVPAQAQPQPQPQPQQRQRLSSSQDTRQPLLHAPTGLTGTQATPQPRNPHRDRNPDSAVPAWLDRAIVGVAVGLAVMVCRKLVYL